MRLISVCANGPSAGKTTLCGLIATHLIQQGAYNSRVLSFAQPIKDIATEHFGWDGEKDEKGRALLENIGMGGRAYDPDIWVRKWQDKVINTLSTFQNTYILCDDQRFYNELTAIKRMGGVTVKVIREGFERPDLKAEQYIPPDDLVDFIVENDGDMQSLNNKAREIVEKVLSWKRK